MTSEGEDQSVGGQSLPRYVYWGQDGQEHHTCLTPEQQGETLRRYAMGESANSIAQSYGLAQPTITHFLKTRGADDVFGLLPDRVLQEQYMKFREQQFAYAAQSFQEWRELAKELRKLARQCIAEYQERPGDVTPASLSKLLKAYRSFERDRLKLIGISLDTSRAIVEHRESTKDEQQLSITSLQEAGLDTDEGIEKFIRAIEKTKALPEGTD